MSKSNKAPKIKGLAAIERAEEIAKLTTPIEEAMRPIKEAIEPVQKIVDTEVVREVLEKMAPITESLGFIGTKIKERRSVLNMTLAELGDKVGVGASTVRKWETGYIENMRSDKIQKVADALGLTPAYLMGWSDEHYYLYGNIEPMPDMRQVPLIGSIACGEAFTPEEHIESFVEIDKRINADFALRCSGDSMINARVFDGDIVFIKKQADVNNGEIAAVIIDGEATLKRLYKYHDRLELRPENPTHPVLNFEGENLSEVQIIGKAVAFISDIR